MSGACCSCPRRPVEQLSGQTILISGETHTSVALLRLLMKDHYHCDVNYVTGAVTPTLGTDRGPRSLPGHRGRSPAPAQPS